MHVLKTLCGATALAAMLAAPSAARADQWNKLTYLTFSGPVQVPGHTLAAGTYTFKLADLGSDRHVVQIFDKATSKLIATVMTIPDQRLDPTDKPVVMFKETPAGTPAAIQAWFYPGNSIGDEFIYPRQQALRIAKATHSPVLSMADSDNSMSDSDMRGTAVGRIGEDGEPVDSTGGPASAPAPTATTGTTVSAAPYDGGCADAPRPPAADDGEPAGSLRTDERAGAGRRVRHSPLLCRS